jgi:hypothetical protein
VPPVLACWACGWANARRVAYCDVEVRSSGERRRVPLCRRCLTSEEHWTSWRPVATTRRTMLSPPTRGLSLRG